MKQTNTLCFFLILVLALSVSNQLSENTNFIQSAQARKSKKSHAKKSKTKRSKRKSSKKSEGKVKKRWHRGSVRIRKKNSQSRGTHRSSKRNRSGRSGQRTGVKSLWRKDGKRNASTERWNRTQKRIIERPSRSHKAATLRQHYRNRREGRLRLYLSSSPTTATPTKVTSQANGSTTSLSMDEGSSKVAQSLTHTGPQRFHLGLINLSPDSWMDDLELEASTTLWHFNSPLLHSSDDDWNEVKTESRYAVNPNILYRGQINLYSHWVDLSMTYESKAGISLMGDEGTLLNIVGAIPNFIPALAPLSFAYERVRFTSGKVSLKDSSLGLIERQGFEMNIDRYEARWMFKPANVESQSTISASLGYDERGLPRHIYLKERIHLSEEDYYYAYYDISDQLLWTTFSTWDVGVDINIQASKRLNILVNGLFGWGSYQLFTPLEGERLDYGNLIGLGFKVGVEYTVPLTPWMSLKASYLLNGRSFEPIGLPSQLERSLSQDEIETDDLSISFDTIDLLHRTWLSLVINLASRPLSL